MSVSYITVASPANKPDEQTVKVYVGVQSATGASNLPVFDAITPAAGTYKGFSIHAMLDISGTLVVAPTAICIAEPLLYAAAALTAFPSALATAKALVPATVNFGTAAVSVTTVPGPPPVYIPFSGAGWVVTNQTLNFVWANLGGAVVPASLAGGAVNGRYVLKLYTALV